MGAAVIIDLKQAKNKEKRGERRKKGKGKREKGVYRRPFQRLLTIDSVSSVSSAAMIRMSSVVCRMSYFVCRRSYVVCRKKKTARAKPFRNFTFCTLIFAFATGLRPGISWLRGLNGICLIWRAEFDIMR